jgi:hypothetical protein
VSWPHEREFRIGRLELAAGRPFDFYRWPVFLSAPREEILLVVYWRHHYVSICWLAPEPKRGNDGTTTRS